MRKILVYLTIQLIACQITFAQQKEFPYLNEAQVVGVYNTGNDVIALSRVDYRTIDNKDIYLASYLNSAQNQLEIAVPRGSKFAGVTSNKEETYLVFDLSSMATLTVIHLDQNRKLTYGEFIRPEGVDFNGSIRGIETNSVGQLFILSQYAIPIKNDKGQTIKHNVGTEYLSYDKTLKQTGALRIDGISRLVGVFPITEGIVVSVETKIFSEKKYELKLLIFDNNLSLKGEHLLTAENSYFPSEIISDNGQIIMAGYSLKKTISDNQATDGLFVRVLKMDGTVQTTSEYNWDQLKVKLQNTTRGDFIFNGQKTILVEKIVPSAEGYRLICESYSSNSGVTANEVLLGESADKRNVVSVFDFVIFDINKSGALTSVKILEKEHMNIEIGGSYSRSFSGLALENLLKRNRAMPFQSYADNKISFINFRNKTGTLAVMDINTGEITNGPSIFLEPVFTEEITLTDARIADSKVLSKLAEIDEKSTNLDEKLTRFGNNLEYGLEKIDYVLNPSAKWNLGWHTLTNGKTVIYLFYPERYSIFYEVQG